MIEVFTNGSKLGPKLNKELVDSGLQRINISLEGLSSERYLKVAGAKINWEDFVKNIKDLYDYSRNKGDLSIYVKIVNHASELKGETIFSMNDEEKERCEKGVEAGSHRGAGYDDMPHPTTAGGAQDTAVAHSEPLLLRRTVFVPSLELEPRPPKRPAAGPRRPSQCAGHRSVARRRRRLRRAGSSTAAGATAGPRPRPGGRLPARAAPGHRGGRSGSRRHRAASTGRPASTAKSDISASSCANLGQKKPRPRVS